MIYTNGVFSFASKPEISRPHSIKDRLVRMICGTETEDKRLILGTYAVFSTEALIGIIPQEIELNASNPSAIDLRLHNYDAYSGKIGFTAKFTLDCKKQTIFGHHDPNKILDITGDGQDVSGYKYLSKISCDYAEKNL